MGCVWIRFIGLWLRKVYGRFCEKYHEQNYVTGFEMKQPVHEKVHYV
jgi:hypothetical protein